MAQTPSDSLSTPFRKGRWLTGISGTFSSSTNKLRSTDDRSTSNQFGLNINGGSFFKDRWLVGGLIQIDGTEFEGNADITSETFFIGPAVSHYLSPSSQGSLFVLFAPGYARYRDSLNFENAMTIVDQTSSGSGFALNFGLGYSYVIIDRIAFDIGFSVNQAWFSINIEDEGMGTETSDKISISNIAFSFGFKILLEKFLQ